MNLIAAIRLVPVPSAVMVFCPAFKVRGPTVSVPVVVPAVRLIYRPSAPAVLLSVTVAVSKIRLLTAVV